MVRNGHRMLMIRGFARTYEGLKQAQADLVFRAARSFARTYEGLKHRLLLEVVKGDAGVLPVPMRD